MISGLWTSQKTGTNEDGTPIYDRAVSEDFLESYFKKFTSDGVFPSPATSLKVVAGSGLKVEVMPGSCLIGGKYGYIETKETIVLPVAGFASYTGLIVARKDNINREITLALRKGTTEPVRDIDVTELGLATVYVKAGSITISQANITDLRAESRRCGFVFNPLQEIDVTDQFTQFQATFNTWFNGVRDKLSTDVAGNLYNMINPLATSSGTLNIDALPVGFTMIWWTDTLPSEKWAFGDTPIEPGSIAWAIWGEKTPATQGRVLVDKSVMDTEFNEVFKTGGNKTQNLKAAIGATGGDISSIGYKASDSIPGVSYDYSVRTGHNVSTSPVNHSTPVLGADGSEPSNLQPYAVCRLIYKIW